jgi:hypothetical protein
MKKSYTISLILGIFLIGIILTSTINLNNTQFRDENQFSETENHNNSNLHTSQPFELIQDFEASTYFISPGSSPGDNDGVFFSFMANKKGNYTLQIENHPAFLTDSEAAEDYVSFDNPSGTNLWYIGYSEMDQYNLGRFNFKMLVSEDKGKTWTSRFVNNITGELDDVFDMFFYVSGNAIAVNPNTGFMIMVAWINSSDLICFRSFDNGTTWSDPIEIFNSTVMGTKNIFGVFGDHPRIDVAIMQNGSVLVVSEAEDPKLTDLVFVQSDNNGTDWIEPQNVSCTSVSTESTAEIPKLQVDRNSGEYWLMWKNDELPSSGYNDTLRWAQFQPNQNLFANVQYKNTSNYRFTGSYDFYFDHANNKFRFIHLGYDAASTVLIENWTCSDYNTNLWSRTILGAFGIGSLYQPSIYLNYVYTDNNHFFYEWEYIGNTDIFHFETLKENVFWVQKGNFEKDVLKQIYWNGRKYDGTPIETSLVKVLFEENHTGEDGRKKLYIIIDNDYPSIREFQQGRHYFNPLSSNITLAEIPWDILPSESCNAYLEIFREKNGVSSWSQILENNWDDSEPKIFYSDKGILYAVYQSFEAGRQIIYLIKSNDNGITWSNPVKLYETSSYVETFLGAAWSDVVFIYIQIDHYQRYLYRSFDQGITFQNPINIYDASLFPIDSEQISDLEISRNGTMFMTYRNRSSPFYIIRSADLGINWSISKIFPGNNSMNIQYHPVLGYDSINDLVYFAMPLDHTSAFPDFNKILNISIATFNISKNEWSPLNSTGIFDAYLFTQNFQFIITKDNDTATPKVRLIYLYDLELPELIFYHKEIVSDNLGESWSDPQDINLEHYDTACSNLYEIFYIGTNTDGNDGELFIKREGKLVRTEQETLTSTFATEIKFDGIDDFGDLIDEGNYTYKIHLVDNAGNRIIIDGWFYADYNAPQITEYSTNWVIPPTPRNDVTVSVNVTDCLNFTTYIYYKKDFGSWQKLVMNNIGQDYYTATIPGDTITFQTQYYIKAVDLAENEVFLDNEGSYYTYAMPSFSWDSEGLFKESKSYSSSQDYDITIEITNGLEYVDEVIFRYSYDEGDEWDDLELEQNSPEFSGELEDIPGDLRELQYKVIVIDIYGNEHELTDTREVEFYPEVPSVVFEQGDMAFIIIISAIVGIVVGIGYIKLKSTSHETLYRQIFLKDYAKKIEKTKKPSDDKLSKTLLKRFKKESIDHQLEVPEEVYSSTPFTKVYLGILCATISVFLIALLFAVFAAPVGMLILAASLLMGVFGYMILMSRDITINIYLERIHLKNVALEVFQIFFMFINIVAILLVGFTIDWFRYYLIESTYNFGTTSIPRLYFSIFAVFFTSLVLVGITTYVQLRKTVKNLRQQSSQGASPNLLLYLKDQNASRLITRLGYKTVIFLVTVLLAVVTTTNLLTEETGIALLVIIIPFAVASFLTLMVHRYYEMKSKERKKEDIQLPFSDSKKFCSKCGEPLYLSNKFCGSCGSQQIYEDMFGKYVSRCTECNALINDKSKYCTECGKKL